MTELYVAAENIPAGYDVIVQPGFSLSAYGYGPVERKLIGLSVGVAAENLREGFRLSIRGREVFEDDG